MSVIHAWASDATWTNRVHVKTPVVTLCLKLYLLEGVVHISALLLMWAWLQLHLLVGAFARVMIAILVMGVRTILAVRILHDAEVQLKTLLLFPISAVGLAGWLVFCTLLVWADKCDNRSGDFNCDMFVKVSGWFVVSNILMFIFSLSAWFRASKQATEEVEDRNGWQARISALSTSVIGKYWLENSTVRQVRQDEVGRDICVICLCEFQADEIVVELVCRHSFHQDCVQSWQNAGGGHCPMRCDVASRADDIAAVDRGAVILDTGSSMSANDHFDATTIPV